MSRSIQYLVALLVIVAASYILFTYGQRSADMGSTVVTTTASTSTVAKMTVVPVQEDTATYSIDVTYPQFGIASVDAAIKSVVDTALEEFRGYAPNPPDSATPRNSFIGQFDHVYQGQDVVSVSLVASEDTGGAHPNTSITTVNVDPRTGHVLSLDDALALIDKTLQQVASSSRSQVKTALGSDALFEEGFIPSPSNYSVFRVDASNVTFVFNVYQVAAYAAGPQEAVFPRVK